MKIVILAGGLGTRISEESHLKPKPMIEIGEFPILVHIMKIYAAQGFKDFIVCGGYKQEIIKDYFNNIILYNNDVLFTFKNEKTILNKNNFDWNVIVSDTGLHTQTAGRLKKIEKYVGRERFMLTYGDAVGDINFDELLKSHIDSHKLATISVYNYIETKGMVNMNASGEVVSFNEKSGNTQSLINIGFMIFEPEIFDLITGDDINLETDIFPRLVSMNQLNAYVHKGFWQCMDTMSEKLLLEKLYSQDDYPWKIKTK